MEDWRKKPDKGSIEKKPPKLDEKYEKKTEIL